MDKLICKKGLYRSIYKGEAFTKGKEYKFLEKDKEGLIWVEDNEGNEFNFSRIEQPPYYNLEEYFDIEEGVLNK